MLKSYKYRLNPTSEQISLMEKTFNPIKYVTGGEPGRGRGVAGVGRGCEASKCTGVNWYIITLVYSQQR